MKTALNQYFSILRLADEPFVNLMQDRDRVRWALALFLVMGLVAGSGKWLSLGYEIQRSTSAERIERLTERSADLGQLQPGISARDRLHGGVETVGTCLAQCVAARPGNGLFSRSQCPVRADA